MNNEVYMCCVKQGEVLKVVTSIYMFTKEAPLPQPDEVLLCTPQTTNEEVLTGFFFSFFVFVCLFVLIMPCVQKPSL